LNTFFPRGAAARHQLLHVSSTQLHDDVYRGNAEAMANFIDFSCFVSMFPHLVAGPILKVLRSSPINSKIAGLHPINSRAASRFS